MTLSGDSAERKIGSAVGFGDAMLLAVERDLRAETAHEAIGIDTIIFDARRVRLYIRGSFGASLYVACSAIFMANLSTRSCVDAD